MSNKFILEGIINSFDTWIELGICPDCGADLDLNGECLDWSEDVRDKEKTYYNLETYRESIVR